jgi:predicted  nucleic acid-binding Zn-ribbon protein
MDADLARLETMLANERHKLETSHSFEREQDAQLQDEEDSIRNSKAKLGAVRTARELSSAQREIEGTRRLAQARSEELTKIAAAISSAEERIASMQAALGELRERFTDERGKLETSGRELNQQLARAQSSRGTLTSAIERELLRTYERIRKRAGGIAFVAVRERRCAACKMQVPHQIYVGLRKGDQIPACETCGRLLYWAGHFRKDGDDRIASAPTQVAAPKRAKKAKKAAAQPSSV